MAKKCKPNPRRLREQGSWRVNKIVLGLFPKYPSSNFTIVPKYEYGTGADIIVYNNQTRKVYEVHEVLNWKRYLRDGRVLRIIPPRFNSIIKNLTKPVHRVYGIGGQIRIYTKADTLKSLHVSYKDCLSSSQLKKLRMYKIHLEVYNRTELVNGYFIETKRSDSTIIRKYYSDTGTFLKSKIIKVRKR